MAIIAQKRDKPGREDLSERNQALNVVFSRRIGVTRKFLCLYVKTQDFTGEPKNMG